MEGQKFKLGQVVATSGVRERMEADKEFRSFCMTALGRHNSGDWGDMAAEDKELNEAALKSGEARLHSSYVFRAPEDKLWIITEWDRSVTTLLFPDEY